MNQDIDLRSRPLGMAMHVDDNRSMENRCRWLIVRPVEGATGKGVCAMSKIVVSVIFVAFTSCMSAMGAWAADPMSQKEATPDLKERLMKDAVKGTLMQINGEHYVIKDDDGKEVRVHVDTSTKLDKVVKGDRVKAYITEKGHATTLQRLEK